MSSNPCSSNFFGYVEAGNHNDLRLISKVSDPRVDNGYADNHEDAIKVEKIADPNVKKVDEHGFDDNTHSWGPRNIDFDLNIQNVFS